MTLSNKSNWQLIGNLKYRILRKTQQSAFDACSAKCFFTSIELSTLRQINTQIAKFFYLFTLRLRIDLF